MDLAARLEQDYITAYKAKDSLRLGVLRLLKTALKNFQVEHLRPPTEDDIQNVIARQCKQRQDSVEQYTKAGRPELADKEARELDVLRGYLPAPLEGEALQKAVTQALEVVAAKGMKDMGRVMQHLNTAHKGRIDGKAASQAVKTALESLT